MYESMKANNNRHYLLVAASTFAALGALTILCAQPRESPGSQTHQGTARSNPEQNKEAEGKNDMSGINDFDFLIGSWRVHHRRMKERLAYNNEWEEFDGTSRAQKILGGQGNMDDNMIELPAGTYRAASIRTYDPATKLWSIWWIDSRTPAHLDPPLVGGFRNGVGTFYAADTFKGKPIRVRYLWTHLATTPRWEQAFSDDGGKTWETNWTMDFTKVR
jgi:hypothetical protein